MTNGRETSRFQARPGADAGHRAGCDVECLGEKAQLGKAFPIAGQPAAP